MDIPILVPENNPLGLTSMMVPENSLESAPILISEEDFLGSEWKLPLTTSFISTIMLIITVITSIYYFVPLYDKHYQILDERRRGQGSSKEGVDHKTVIHQGIVPKPQMSIEEALNEAAIKKKIEKVLDFSNMFKPRPAHHPTPPAPTPPRPHTPPKKLEKAGFFGNIEKLIEEAKAKQAKAEAEKAKAEAEAKK